MNWVVSSAADDNVGKHGHKLLPQFQNMVLTCTWLRFMFTPKWALIAYCLGLTHANLAAFIIKCQSQKL